MDNNRGLYKGKPFIEIYEFLPVAGMPIFVFQMAPMIYSQLMIFEGTIILLISALLYLTSDEFKIFRSVKKFRSNTVIFYMLIGIFSFMVGLFELLPLMLLTILASLFWVYYVYNIYKMLYNSENI